MVRWSDWQNITHCPPKLKDITWRYHVTFHSNWDEWLSIWNQFVGYWIIRSSVRPFASTARSLAPHSSHRSLERSIAPELRSQGKEIYIIMSMNWMRQFHSIFAQSAQWSERVANWDLSTEPHLTPPACSAPIAVIVRLAALTLPLLSSLESENCGQGSQAVLAQPQIEIAVLQEPGFLWSE